MRAGSFSRVLTDGQAWFVRSPSDGKRGGEHLYRCVFTQLQSISGTLSTRKGIATRGSALGRPHRGQGLSVSEFPGVAELPQAAPRQERRGYLNVSVMVPRHYVHKWQNPRLELGHACLCI